jgi:hypothetical protein
MDAPLPELQRGTGLAGCWQHLPACGRLGHQNVTMPIGAACAGAVLWRLRVSSLNFYLPDEQQTFCNDGSQKDPTKI